MIRASTTTLALLASVALAGSSFGATINFDDVNAGGGVVFAPSTNYQSVGVLFSRNIPVMAISVAEAWFQTNFIAAGCTWPNAMGLGDAFGAGHGG